MTVALTDATSVEQVDQKVAARLGQTKHELWFRSTRLTIEGHTMRVEAPNRFVADWISRHFHDDLLAVAREEIGPHAEVVVIVATPEPVAKASPRSRSGQPQHAEPNTARSAPAQAAPPARAPHRLPAMRHSLDDFIVGPSNELAYTAACRMADGEDERLRIVFVHGACGLGKTHLLQGLCARYAEHHPQARIRYTTAEEFTNQYLHALRHNQLPEFRRRIRGLDLLAVDDVHFLSSKQATQTEFLHTFNTLDLGGARVVLASDAHPKLIEQMGQALISRFMCGMVVRVDLPDVTTRGRIIQALALRRGLRLMDSAARQLADQMSGSVREIEGMLIKLAAMACLSEPQGKLAAASGQQVIGHALVSRLFAPGLSSGPSRPIRLEQILQTVCREMTVERTHILSRSRHRRVVLARAAIVHLARKLTSMSYPELAKGLGRPNHSTVVTAAQRIDKQIRAKQALTPADTELACTTDQLVEHLARMVRADAARNGS